MARWLPRLMPPGGRPAGISALKPLLDQLSSEAADEVRQALGQHTEASDLAAFQAAAVELLGRATSLDVPAETALSTVEAAIKKHPMGQESHSRRAAWIVDLVHGVTRVLGLCAELPGLDPRDTLQLYRVFPRLVDREAGQSVELFLKITRHRLVAGDQPHELIRRPQLLKDAHKPVTSQDLGGLSV